MKYNNDYTKEELINLNKTRLLFLGFLIGIIPFIILLTIMAIHEGGINYLPNVLKSTLIIAGLITACINSLAFKKMYIEKIK